MTAPESAMPVPLGSPASVRSGRGRRLVPTVLVALALLASACGGGDKGGDAAGGGGGSGSGGTGGNRGTMPGGLPVVDNLPPCPLDALQKASGPVEVVVWHFLQGETRRALEEIAAAYNASQSKVKVRVENQGTSNDEIWDKYRAGIKNKDLPGIAMLDDTVTEQIIDSETVLPAQSCIQADNYDMSDFLPSARSFYTVHDVLYPVSLNLSGALLYYNKNHFTRAGLDPNKTPATLEEVRDAARKIKAARIVDKPVVLQISPPIIEMLLTGAGIPIVDNGNGRGGGTTTKAAFDRPEAVALFQWFRSMIDEGLLDALPQTPGQIGQYLAMGTQKSSMTIETSTAATSIQAFLQGKLKTDGLPAGIDPTSVNVNDLNIGAGPVPGIQKPGRLAMGGGAWYITSLTAPEVQAGAWDFVKFFNKVESQVTWTTIGGYLPYRVSAIKDPKLEAQWTTTLAGRWLAIAHEELLEGIDPAFPGPLIGPYDDVRKSIRGAVDDLIFNNASPEAVVKKAADGTTDVITKYNKEK